MKCHAGDILVAIILSVLCLSCGNNADTARRLDAAEAIMDSDSGAALDTLESIDGSALGSRRLRARHSLLYSMALDKNYVDLKTDSIIAPAVKYYKNHGSADDRLKALYYLGRVQYNAGDYNSTIVTLTEAIPLFARSSATRYFSLVHCAIADTYNMSYMFNDCYENLEIAYSYALECHDSVLADIIRYRKAQALFNLKKYNEADKLYVSVMSDNRIGYRVRARILADYALLRLTAFTSDTDSVCNLYKHALALSGGFDDINHWGAYAYALNESGDSAAAENLFAQMSESGPDFHPFYCSWKSKALAAASDYKGAYLLLSESLSVQDSLVRQHIMQSVSKSQGDFFSAKNAESYSRIRVQRIVICLIVISFILLSVIVYLLYNRKVNVFKDEYDRLIDIYEETKSQLREADKFVKSYIATINDMNSEMVCLREKGQDLLALRKEYAKMYKAQFTCIGNLCEVFLRSNNRHDSPNAVYAKVLEMLQDIIGDASGQCHFENMIDKTLNGIMARFRADFPSYSETDFRFVSYLIVGFDATLLMMIFNMPSQASVYMKKSRIKKMVEQSSSPYKQDYLTMLF